MKKLLDEIELAFKDVKLGDGISLNMTEYLDSYKSEPLFKELAKNDERNNWKNIADKELEKFTTVFFFTDELGFKFYIPAYMSWCLNNSTSSSIIGDHTVYALDPDRIKTLQKKSINQILDKAQLNTIIKFLEWCIFENGDYRDAIMAEQNLDKIIQLVK